MKFQSSSGIKLQLIPKALLKIISLVAKYKKYVVQIYKAGEL